MQPGDHASPLSYGSPGVLHGSYSYVMQDEDGQTCDVHSVSAGLDYPGVGPEHSFLKEIGRAEYVSAMDEEVLDTFLLLSREEGIFPAFESSHAVAWVLRQAGQFFDIGMEDPESTIERLIRIDADANPGTLALILANLVPIAGAF